MPLVDVYAKENDTGSSFQKTLEDENGAAVDVTGATVRFTMTSALDGTVKISEAAATIDDAVNGLVSYTWAAGDLDTPGDYFGEFEVTFSGGDVQTFPNDGHLKIRVTEEQA